MASKLSQDTTAHNMNKEMSIRTSSTFGFVLYIFDCRLVAAESPWCTKNRFELSLRSGLVLHIFADGVLKIE